MVGRLALASLCAAFAMACGKYSPPIPPEQLAPKQVEALQVTADAEGVVFKWSAPSTDRRGKELKYIDGYRVDRTEVRQDFLGALEGELEWDGIGNLRDTHVKVREKLRAEARAQGKVGRRVDAPAELKEFTFRDSTATPGKLYLYQVVPLNQGGVEGVSRNVARVLFRGTSSEISIVPREKIDGTTGEELDAGVVTEWAETSGVGQ